MRWYVDAMNVIGTRPDGWWRDRRGAIERLLGELETWAAEGGEDVVLMLERPPSPPLASSVVEVAHAPRPGPNSADREIVRRLRDEPDPGAVRVATSDRDLAEQARMLGATVEPARSFAALLGRGSD